MTNKTTKKPGANVPAPTGGGKVPADTLRMIKTDVVDVVAGKIRQFINSKQIDLPAKYSPENALKSAWLILQNTVDREKRPAMQVCTKDSIANSLLDMIIQGLNPAKKQGYFIVYANQLTFQRSYFGSMAVAEMVNPNIKDWGFKVVYEDDEFEYTIKNGKYVSIDHKQKLENIDKGKIIAAYCMALGTKEVNGMKEPFILHAEIMTIDQIKQAWKQSKTAPVDDKGNVKAESVHGKFAADMAIKTVVNKTCKIIINASSDNALLLERINQAINTMDAAAVQEEIDEEANTGEVLELESIAEETAQHPEDKGPNGGGEETTKEGVNTGPGPDAKEPPAEKSSTLDF